MNDSNFYTPADIAPYLEACPNTWSQTVRDDPRKAGSIPVVFCGNRVKIPKKPFDQLMVDWGIKDPAVMEQYDIPVVPKSKEKLPRRPMTLEEIETSDADYLTSVHIYKLLGETYAYTIVLKARTRTLGFETLISGRNVRIPRLPFVKFMKEEYQGDY